MTEKQKKNNVADLQKKRTCPLNEAYDATIGIAINKFNNSKLPQCRHVLQRYRSIRTNNHNLSLNETSKIIAEELVIIWRRTTIPHKSIKAVIKSVKVFLDKWSKIRPEKRNQQEEQTKIDNLFDIRPANLLDEQALTSHLKKYSSCCYFEELQFFQGQLSHPQTSSILTTVDKTKTVKDQEKIYKQDKFEQYKLVNTTESKEENKLRKSANTIISQQDTIINTKRSRSRQSVSSTIANDNCSEEVLNTKIDNEWEPSDWQKRKMKKKSVTLELPTKSIPSILGCTSTTTKTSIRQELKITSTLVKAGGGDINDLSQSVSTIYRQRKRKIAEVAASIRNDIQKSTRNFFVVHMDGKIIQLMSGTVQDRLAICISVPNETSGQFLASPELAQGTGENMAQALYECLSEYQLTDNIHAIVFDTTSSNSGKWKGSVALFEKKVEKVLLWLACRHHVSELCIKHSHEAVRGHCLGPDDPLFKRFKERFGFLIQNDRKAWSWPNDWRRQKAEIVLTWADDHMERGTWPREDYRELLELVVIFLGGIVKRIRKERAVPIDVIIRKPGAVHQAMFMARCLYILKIALFLHQEDFGLKRNNKKQEVYILAKFIALLYAPYFLQAPLTETYGMIYVITKTVLLKTQFKVE